MKNYKLMRSPNGKLAHIQGGRGILCGKNESASVEVKTLRAVCKECQKRFKARNSEFYERATSFASTIGIQWK